MHKSPHSYSSTKRVTANLPAETWVRVHVCLSVLTQPSPPWKQPVLFCMRIPQSTVSSHTWHTGIPPSTHHNSAPNSGGPFQPSQHHPDLKSYPGFCLPWGPGEHCSLILKWQPLRILFRKGTHSPALVLRNSATMDSSLAPAMTDRTPH